MGPPPPGPPRVEDTEAMEPLEVDEEEEEAEEGMMATTEVSPLCLEESLSLLVGDSSGRSLWMGELALLYVKPI